MCCVGIDHVLVHILYVQPLFVLRFCFSLALHTLGFWSCWTGVWNIISFSLKNIRVEFLLLLIQLLQYWHSFSNHLPQLDALHLLFPTPIKVMLSWPCWGHRYCCPCKGTCGLHATSGQVATFWIGHSLVHLLHRKLLFDMQLSIILSNNDKQTFGKIGRRYPPPTSHTMANQRGATLFGTALVRFEANNGIIQQAMPGTSVDTGSLILARQSRTSFFFQIVPRATTFWANSLQY